MKHSWFVTFFLVALFAAAQLIGLAVIDNYALKTDEGVSWKDLPSVAGVSVERPDVAPSLSIWYILVAVIIGTLFILLLVKFGKVLLWKLWFLIAIVMCLTIAFGSFLTGAWAFLLALVLGVWKVVRPNIVVHNLTELFVYGGLAAIFVPILNVFYAFVLLIALSFYDMYAVWKSKHMVSMAKFQTKSGIFAGLLIPYSYKMPKAKSGRKQKKVERRVRTAVLGGGDIGFPLILAGTVFISYSMNAALLVAAGATLSLVCLLLASKKDRFYPAMPFLTAGCAFGFVISLLL